MFVCDFVGLRVYSLHSGSSLGYVVGFVIRNNRSKIQSLIIANDEDDFERILPVNKIFKSTKQCLLVANSERLSLLENEKHVFSMGKQAFDLDGNEFGFLDDIELSDNFTISNFIFSCGKKLTPKQICLIGKDCIFVSSSGKQFSKSRFAPKSQKPLANLKVSLLTLGEPPIQEQTATKVVFPKVVIEPIENMLGKIASKTVVGRNNELVVKKGEKITHNIIERAKKHNIVTI